MINVRPEELPARLDCFRRQAEVLRSLGGLALAPRLYDFIEEGETARLVLEYIPGRDLWGVLEANGHQPFPFDRVVEWGVALCDLLAAMHAQDPPLLYAGMEPGNILLLADGRSIRVVGFTLARPLGLAPRSWTASRLRVYGMCNAPPEQIIGKPEPRSDLYALAGTLYELATGKAPEELGMHPAGELAKQLAAPDSPLPAQHRWLYELLAINLAEDVHERYFSAREVKADLERRQVTRQVECGQCRQVNPVRPPYCLACCQPLTELSPIPCGACAGQNRLGSRHCVHCGGRLR